MIRSAAVWQGMKQLYGTPFLSIHGETPSWLWIQAIDQLTDAQAKAALVELAKQRLDFPANLSVFMAVARKHREVRFLGKPMTAAERKHLAAQKQPPTAITERRIDAIRANLGMRPSPHSGSFVDEAAVVVERIDGSLVTRTSGAA